MLSGGDVYMSADVEDESEQLQLVAVRLALQLSASHLEEILQRRTKREVTDRRAAVRGAVDDAERLLSAVGQSDLRSGLGDSTLTILEGERGGLTGVEIAEAVIATYHTDALRQFKWALGDLDPPKQWAGSSAACRVREFTGLFTGMGGSAGEATGILRRGAWPFQAPAAPWLSDDHREERAVNAQG